MKFKSGIRLGKGLRKFMTGKACEPFRNIMTFSKKCNQKSMISAPKTQNTYKVQKCPQKASGSLYLRDMSNLNFSQNSQKNAILRAISPWERCKVIFLTKKATHPLRNFEIFCKFCEKFKLLPQFSYSVDHFEQKREKLKRAKLYQIFS